VTAAKKNPDTDKELDIVNNEAKLGTTGASINEGVSDADKGKSNVPFKIMVNGETVWETEVQYTHVAMIHMMAVSGEVAVFRPEDTIDRIDLVVDLADPMELPTLSQLERQKNQERGAAVEARAKTFTGDKAIGVPDGNEEQLMAHAARLEAANPNSDVPAHYQTDNVLENTESGNGEEFALSV